MLIKKYNQGPMFQTTKQVNAKIPCGNGASGVNANNYLIIEINNTNNTPAVARVFDASGLAQIKEGRVNQNGVLIRGISTSYQAVLNNLASTEQYCIDYTKIRVDAGKEQQFENTWEIFEDIPFTNETKLVKQIYPSVYEDAMNQQANLLTIADPFTITRKTTLQINMEPNTKLLLRMHLSVIVQNG